MGLTERFQALLDGVGSALDFRLENLRRKYDLKEDSQRLQYVQGSRGDAGAAF